MATVKRNIQFQERDRRIFDDFVECGGILDSATVRERRFPTDTTGEACLRRLRLFCAHELLVVYRPAIDFGAATAGRMPAVYRLTPKGAALVHELTGVQPPVAVAGLSALTLEHRLGMAKLRLLVNDACAHEKLPAPQWIGEYELRPGPRPPIGAKLSQRFRLCHQYKVNGAELTCWPDAASLISVPGNDAGSFHRLLVLWEYDRSTERIFQVKAKLPGYRQFLANHDDRRLFENEVAVTRIFFATKSAERRGNIAAAVKDEPGSDAVRLAAVSDLSPQTFFRDQMWFTPHGIAKAIMPNQTKNPVISDGVKAT